MYSTVVVVLWSKAARESAFIREALKHANRNSTVVVLLEKIEPPPEETNSSVIDLSEWDGSDPKVELRRPLSVSPTPGRSLLKRQFIGPLLVEPQRPMAAWGLELKHLLLFIRYVMREAANESEPAAPPNLDSPGNDRPAVQPQTDDAAGQAHTRHAGGQSPGRLFISYRRNEASAYAGRLYDRLAARFGRERVFIDTENVGWGEDFVEAITSAAESCAVMIALISPRWSRGAGAEKEDYVRLEVAKALGRKQIRVIPILIQGASMPPPNELPEDLAPLVRRNALALSDTRWERDVEDLLKALETLLKD